MNKQRAILAILYVGAAVLAGGCMLAVVGAGAAGTVAYVKGDLEAVEGKKLDVVYEATLKAMEQLELNVSSAPKDAMSATITSRDAQDKRIKIKLVASAEDSTAISIRYGTRSTPLSRISGGLK